MPDSPKNFSSHFTSSTASRGVVTRQVTGGANKHIHLGMDLSTMTQSRTDSIMTLEAAPPQLPPNTDSRSQYSIQDETSSSYLQVVVHKQGRNQQVPTSTMQTSPRRPVASSPIVKENLIKQASVEHAAGDANLPPRPPGMYVLQQPMLLPYPTAPAHGYIWQDQYKHTAEAACEARNSASFKKLVLCQRGKPRYKPACPKDNTTVAESSNTGSVWKKLSKAGRINYKPKDIDPEVVEVYPLERGSSRYVVGAAARATVAGRTCARLDALFQRGLAELLAAPACLLHVPVTVALHLLEVACGVARRAVGGVAAALGTGLLAPALAALHNACVAPACGALAAALRALLLPVRPLSAALRRLAAAPARLLAAPRLVSVRR